MTLWLFIPYSLSSGDSGLPSSLFNESADTGSRLLFGVVPVALFAMQRREACMRRMKGVDLQTVTRKWMTALRTPRTPLTEKRQYICRELIIQPSTTIISHSESINYHLGIEFFASFSRGAEWCFHKVERSESATRR